MTLKLILTLTDDLELGTAERSCHKKTCVKYEGSNSYQTKDMVNDKVLQVFYEADPEK